MELPTLENTLLEFDPIKRMVPITMIRTTASITAYSAISCPSSCDHNLRTMPAIGFVSLDAQNFCVTTPVCTVLHSPTMAPFGRKSHGCNVTLITFEHHSSRPPPLDSTPPRMFVTTRDSSK